MSSSPTIAAALELSPAERILLVEEIWDSLAATPEAVPVTAAQERELDARIEAYRKDHDPGLPWDQVKAQLRKKG